MFFFFLSYNQWQNLSEIPKYGKITSIKEGDKMENLVTNRILGEVKEDNKLSRLEYMKNKVNVAALGVASSINFLSLLGDSQTEGFACGFSLITVAALVAQYFQYYETYEKKCLEEYVKKIKNIPEYKAAIYYYETFIRELIKYLSSINIKSPLDICIYSKAMLDKGYFSKNHAHKYYNYKFSYPCDYALLGGRVFTGTSVCRHMALFFNDILNETGALVTPLMVRAYEEKELPKIPVFIKHKPNHLIIGLRQNGANIAYDPTNGSFATYDSKDRYAKPGSSMLKSLTGDNYYLITKEQDEELLGQSKDIYEEYSTSQYHNISTKKEILHRKHQIIEYFKQNRLNNDDFFESQYDNIVAIANYQEKLCPQKNGKEFKW